MADEEKKDDVVEEKEDEKEQEVVEDAPKEEAEEKDEPEAEEEVKDDEVDKAVAKLMAKITDSIEVAKKDAKRASVASDKKMTKMPSGPAKTAEFIKALFVNDHQKLELLSEGTAADGGYLVPEEWANEIVMYLGDATVVRPRATVIQITTDTFHLPQLASKPKVYWRSELATKTTSTATYDEITLTPYSLAAIVGLSNELVADAKVGLPGGIVSHISQLLGEAIAVEEDKAFMTGNGTGRPTGIDNYTFTTINAANALTGDHLIQAYYRMGQGYRGKGGWIMNSRVISNIRQLKDSQNRYLFDNALNPEGFPTLLGRPVYEQNDIASSKIFYGDLSKYYIAQREGVSVRVNDTATVAGSSAFEKNLTWVRVEERVDGELVDTRAFVEISNTGVA